MNTLEYRFHSGARGALTIVAVLCFFLIVAAPIAIWVLIRSRTALVRISPTETYAKGLYTSTSFNFAEVARLGLLEAPIVARGIGGALVKRRFDGDKAIHIVVKTNSGKTCKIGVSQYENYRDIIAKVSERAQKPYEQLKTGLIGIKWPGE
ncbi:MAG TPA: hypothetical protein VHU80_18600 [Polyangiaceae bacterium]|jgi:hypothetical protein|nr:hypothetical protein [Polyangiaceae bacterium]